MADTAIIAVGCAGGRMVSQIIERGRIKAEYPAINTDRRMLEACLVDRKILIGEPRFQGRGGAKPHVIMEESAAAVEAIRQSCAGRESVIIVAGLGGGTGTGVARRGCYGRGNSGAADDVGRVEGADGAEGQATAG